jgi:cytochrome P450
MSDAFQLTRRNVLTGACTLPLALGFGACKSGGAGGALEGTDAPDLPPGSDSILETLDFVSDAFDFVDARKEKYGGIFRTNLVGRPTVVVWGPEAHQLIIDYSKVKREGAAVANLREFFGRSVGQLDSTEFDARKEIINAALGPENLAAWMPRMQARFEALLESGAKLPQFELVSAIKFFCFEQICLDLMSIDKTDDARELQLRYESMLDGISSVPINLPGFRFRSVINERDDVLKRYLQIIGDHRAKPRQDGLQAMINGRTKAGGVSLTDEQLSLELHHIIVAGYIIYSQLIGMVVQLQKHPDVFQRLQAEVQSILPSGPIAEAQLRQASYLGQVVLEVKRTTPLLGIATFCIAKEDLHLYGKRIPKGWVLGFAHRAAMMDPHVFKDPEKFDPDRFSEARAEHTKFAEGFVPHGPGPATAHRCPGMDYTTQLVTIAAVTYLRRYRLEVLEQELRYDMSRQPPEPIGGLRARLVSKVA